MSELRIYSEQDAEVGETLTEHKDIAAEMSKLGIQFERWATPTDLAEDADAETVQAAYGKEIAQLNEQFNFQSVDVMSMHPQHPDKAAFREKFLDEHSHDDFEIRFFVDGEGLFYIRQNGKVYGLLCCRGDLVSIPPNTTHWFDMGPNPSFTAIRFFTTEDGWVGHFTGDDIAGNYPRLDN